MDMTPADRRDFRALSTLLKTDHIQLKSASWLCYSSMQPRTVLVRKTLYALEPWMPVKLLQKKVTPAAFCTAQLLPKASLSLLTAAKRADLRKMVPYLPD